MLRTLASSGPRPSRRLLRVALTLLALSSASAVRAETLQQLIDTALTSHPNAELQKALEQSARAGVDVANWQFFPTFSFTSEHARARTGDPSYPGDGTVSTLRLQQPLWTGGRLTAGRDKAEANAEGSEAATQEVRRQLAQRVVQAYGDWLASQKKFESQEKSLTLHHRMRDLVERRIQQGHSADSDLTLAVSRLESLKADIAATRAQRDIALVRLAVLVGRPVDGVALAATPAAPQPLAGKANEVADLAVASDPGVRRAVAQARLKDATVEERRADLAPEIFVRAERQYGNTSVHDARPENRVFVGLSTRFGAGLSAKSAIEAARFEHQAAVSDIDVQKRSSRERALADYALAATGENRIAALEATLAAAVAVAESYDRQYLAGRKAWQDVMNAWREMTQTEVQLADARATQVAATWRLKIATDTAGSTVAPAQNQPAPAAQTPAASEHILSRKDAEGPGR